ncbi:hypothetical protein C6496_19230 [Candidatus Poribacteria bacterium]|nr:MAG: hypothetical protein C6496_19230 [Candidatus Poribacteria bacterium]
MNIWDMTDAEVYELGLEILLDTLGSAGRIRFLEQCEPISGDYTAERHKWLDGLDMETIMHGIQELRKRKRDMPKDPPQKDLSEMTDIEVYELGLKAISRKLGPVGIIRFVHLFDTDKDTHASESPKRLNVGE